MLILEIFSARLACVFVKALLSRLLTEGNDYLRDFMGFPSAFCVRTRRTKVDKCREVVAKVNFFDAKGFKMFKGERI